MTADGRSTGGADHGPVYRRRKELRDWLLKPKPECPLNRRERWVATALLNHFNVREGTRSYGTAFPSHDTLAAETDYGLRALGEALDVLCDGPFPVFARRSRLNTSDIYTMVSDPIAFAAGRDRRKPPTNTGTGGNRAQTQGVEAEGSAAEGTGSFSEGTRGFRRLDARFPTLGPAETADEHSAESSMNPKREPTRPRGRGAALPRNGNGTPEPNIAAASAEGFTKHDARTAAHGQRIDPIEEYRIARSELEREVRSKHPEMPHGDVLTLVSAELRRRGLTA